MSSAGGQRRRFLARSAAATGALLVAPALATARPRVVVVGGGFGGATCARYLRRLDPGLEVTLVERDPYFITCPFSNLVLGGIGSMSAITHGFDGLRRDGVTVMQRQAAAVDAGRRRVLLAGGGVIGYERLVLAPGVDMDFGRVPGYDRVAANVLPHAWKAGRQTLLLRHQLTAMPDGGTVIVAPPANPYRCPPGPYERASLIAHYLKRHKPRSKILILDAKDKFSKQGLFTQAWDRLYPGMIEWVAGSAGGIVEEVRPHARTLVTESGFTEHRADVINFIPPQRAGAIAWASGLADASGFCPVDQHTFASTRAEHIHVLGDAAIAGPMPKSGFSANSQAKVCAAAIVAGLRGEALPPPSYANTCYSLVAPDYGISVAAVYRLENGEIHAVDGAGGVSPDGADADFRAREAAYARSWYAANVADTWG